MRTLALIGLLACRSPAEPRAPATCDAAAASLARSGAANRRWHAEHRGESIPEAELAAFRTKFARIAAMACAAFRTKFARIAAMACTRDRWTPQVIECFAAAPVEAVAPPGRGAVNTCAKQLTDCQGRRYVMAFRPAEPTPDCSDR